MTEQVIALYDRIVLHSGSDGLRVAEAIDKTAAEVESDPRAYPLPSRSELIANWVAATVHTERKSRANRRSSLFQRVHDALTGQTVMGLDDPILDVAMRTGSADGLDKSLRHFAVDDWLLILGASAENVESAVAADRALRTVVNPIISAYAAHGASRLEQMLGATA